MQPTRHLVVTLVVDVFQALLNALDQAQPPGNFELVGTSLEKRHECNGEGIVFIPAIRVALHA